MRGAHSTSSLVLPAMAQENHNGTSWPAWRLALTCSRDCGFAVVLATDVRRISSRAGPLEGAINRATTSKDSRAENRGRRAKRRVTITARVRASTGFAPSPERAGIEVLETGQSTKGSRGAAPWRGYIDENPCSRTEKVLIRPMARDLYFPPSWRIARPGFGVLSRRLPARGSPCSACRSRP